MPIIFQGAVKSFRCDHEGESVLSFSVPASDKSQANQVSDLTGRVIYITVMDESEVKKRK